VRVIIAGGRRIVNEPLVFAILNPLRNEIPILEVICGKAGGVDSLGETWARQNFIPVTPFPADWKNLKAPGAVIKNNNYGQYNAKAGFNRNEKMAEYGQALVLIWDGNSPGSKDMLTRAKAHGLRIYEYVVSNTGQVERRLI